MVRSSSKLFWNGVPDRIIRFLVRSHFEELRTIMRLLLPGNDEAMYFLNPLTLDNVTYKRVDQEKNGPFSAHPEWRHFVKSLKG